MPLIMNFSENNYAYPHAQYVIKVSRDHVILHSTLISCFTTSFITSGGGFLRDVRGAMARQRAVDLDTQLKGEGGGLSWASAD